MVRSPFLQPLTDPPFALRPWFNVWDVSATCASPWQENILERVTFARLFLLLANWWDCDATGLWVKVYFHNYRDGLPAGSHDFHVDWLHPASPYSNDHTVTFTP